MKQTNKMLFIFLFADKDSEPQEKNQSSVSSSGNAYNQLSNNNQRNSSSSYRGRSERGPSNRGGRGSHNSSSDNRRDDRNRSNNPLNQNQKPPRFQNQQTRYQEPSNFYQNWNYSSGSNEFNNDDRRNYGSSRISGNFDEFNNSDGYQRRTQTNNSFTPGNDSIDYSRNNRRYDNYGKHYIRPLLPTF